MAVFKGIRSTAWCLTPAHFKMITVFWFFFIIDKINPVCPGIDKHISHSGLSRKCKQTAGLFRIIRHSNRINDQLPIIILGNSKQLIVHHVYIFFIQLDICVKRCFRWRSYTYFPPVHIPFNIYIQSPGSMVRLFMVTVIIRRTLNCIGFSRLYHILFIYYFIGHICMVHIHKGPVRVCDKLLLQIFNFIGVQSHLMFISSPYLIRHCGIAGCRCRTLIISCHNHVGIRHRKCHILTAYGFCHSRNCPDCHLPVQEILSISIGFFRVKHHFIAFMDLIISGDI